MKYNKSYKISTLDVNSKVEDALVIMEDNGLKQIAVLHEERYLGLLLYSDIKDQEADIKISELKHLIINIHLEDDFTLFDWLKLKSVYDVENIPVINLKDFNYLGNVTTENIIDSLEGSGLMIDLTSIIVLRKDTGDFKYSEIFQIAEANGAKIFGSYIKHATDNYTDVIVNIQHTGLNELLQSYRRYDYDIISFHDEDQHHETLKANSDYFSKYLTV